jgi:hypothetical protein
MTNFLRTFVIVTAVLTLGLISIPGTASAAKRPPPDFFGMDVGPNPDVPDFLKMRSAGVQSVRLYISWRLAQPTPKAPIQCSLIDRQVGQIASHGLTPVPDLIGSPPWVSSHPTKPPLGGKGKMQAWQSFLGAVVKRYAPGGAFWKSPVPVLNLSPYAREYGAKAPVEPISAWQIWSEPNLGKYFTPHNQAVKNYAKLVEISHKAIKAADPKADVVLGGLTGFASPSSWKFLQKLYRVKGFKKSFEVAALHPYAPSIGELREVVSRVRKTMDKAHDKKTPLWLTENGYGSREPMKKWPLNKGLKGQATALTKSYKLLISNRKKWNIGRVYWFQWRDPPAGENPGVCSFCTSAGLLNNNRSPKPAYKAFVRLTGGR